MIKTGRFATLLSKQINIIAQYYQMKLVSIFFILACTLLACKKVIDIDLSGYAEPRLVIEASLLDTLLYQGSSYGLVRLSKSIGINDSISESYFTGRAFITIQDLDTRIIDTLVMQSPWYYATNKLEGVQGHEYLLTVNAEGKTYTARSKMPYKVYCDSVTNKKVQLLGDVFHNITPRFTDRAGTKNYYKFGGYNFDDSYGDGTPNVRHFGFMYPNASGTRKWFYFINQNEDMYRYNLVLQQNNNNGRANVLTVSNPSNPPTNIQGGALGYFTACTNQLVSTVLE